MRAHCFDNAAVKVVIVFQLSTADGIIEPICFCWSVLFDAAWWGRYFTLFRYLLFVFTLYTRLLFIHILQVGSFFSHTVICFYWSSSALRNFIHFHVHYHLVLGDSNRQRSADYWVKHSIYPIRSRCHETRNCSQGLTSLDALWRFVCLNILKHSFPPRRRGIPLLSLPRLRVIKIVIHNWHPFPWVLCCCGRLSHYTCTTAISWIIMKFAPKRTTVSNQSYSCLPFAALPRPEHEHEND